MKALWIRLVLFLAVLTSKSLLAVYVIPYELRLEGETYTVLVILADHYEHHFGEPDGLTQMLTRNFQSDPHSFASPYLHIPHEWYLKKLIDRPKIYGEDVGKLVETLRQFQPMNMKATSGVIITEHNRIDKVLTFLRIEAAGEDGKLSSERTFLADRLPQPQDVSRWTKVSNFTADSFVDGVFPLGFPTEDRMHYWLEGENIEFKNFGSENFKKFFKHLFFIARAHKLYHWGTSRFPEGMTQFEDGTPIPADAYLSWGKRVSHIWLGAMSDIMVRFYEGMGFKVWGKVSNEATNHRDLFLMVATPDELDGVLTKSLWAPEKRDLLVFDRELTTTLRSFDCKDVHATAGNEAAVTHLRKLITP